MIAIFYRWLMVFVQTEQPRDPHLAADNIKRRHGELALGRSLFKVPGPYCNLQKSSC